MKIIVFIILMFKVQLVFSTLPQAEQSVFEVEKFILFDNYGFFSTQGKAYLSIMKKNPNFWLKKGYFFLLLTYHLAYRDFVLNEIVENIESENNSLFFIALQNISGKNLFLYPSPVIAAKKIIQEEYGNLLNNDLLILDGSKEWLNLENFSIRKGMKKYIYIFFHDPLSYMNMNDGIYRMYFHYPGSLKIVLKWWYSNFREKNPEFFPWEKILKDKKPFLVEMKKGNQWVEVFR
ncbi:MAG: hypothetical protein A2Y41_01160 [Spirochaetes bacterium GWB1_36_13]|nr:MAG: hypothetical protein A2Y41_01160 [Spirochaetes bacterium GWB1_36_13]